LKAPKSTKSRGFTLVEIIIVIAIIGVLIALTFGAIGSMQNSARRAEAISNMRQIGSAIISYAGENDGLLPGPLWPGQMPLLDPERDGRMVRELAPYLDISIPESPKLVDLFIPPAYRIYQDAPDLESARTFVMNMAVESGGEIINPWGNLANPSSGGPFTLARMSSTEWAFSDADQLHPRVGGAPWSSNTPAGIVHGDKRLAFFFGGHVAPVDEENLETP